MSRRRFIADVISGDHATLLGAHAAHLSRVLRARVGQEFDIAANDRVRRGRIIGVEDERVEFELGEDVPADAVAAVVLYLAIVKFDRMEWAIEKCTELGVARIVPLIAARSDTHLVAAAGNRAERWRRLALQASEQSRRTAPPEITSPMRLNRELLSVAGPRIVLAEAERTLSLQAALTPTEGGAAPPLSGETTLAIGPEGGWSDAELKLFCECGWSCASLGNTVLRTETAAIAALAIVMSSR
jgi:16S rRNA (uracil1498-N3)-methyltransferase